MANDSFCGWTMDLITDDVLALRIGVICNWWSWTALIPPMFLVILLFWKRFTANIVQSSKLYASFCAVIYGIGNVYLQGEDSDALLLLSKIALAFCATLAMYEEVMVPNQRWRLFRVAKLCLCVAVASLAVISSQCSVWSVLLETTAGPRAEQLTASLAVLLMLLVPRKHTLTDFIEATVEAELGSDEFAEIVMMQPALENLMKVMRRRGMNGEKLRRLELVAMINKYMVKTIVTARSIKKQKKHTAQQILEQLNNIQGASMKASTMEELAFLQNKYEAIKRRADLFLKNDAKFHNPRDTIVAMNT